jgi:hypothetical protein
MSSLNSGMAEMDKWRAGTVGDRNGMGESSSYILGSSRLDAMASRGDTADFISLDRVYCAVVGRMEDGDCMVEMSYCSCVTTGVGLLTVEDTGIGHMVLSGLAFTEDLATSKGLAVS